MPRRRHTITVASSTLFFVCLMLHAQTGLHSQTSIPRNDVDIYESILPADWTLTVAHARLLFSQAQTGSSAHRYIVLSHVAFNPSAFTDKTIAAVNTRHNCGLVSGGNTFYVVENKSGIWNSLQWRNTSCAWAS